MKQDLTKSQRQRIHELARIAHGRELSRELAALEGEFARWRSGAIDAHELGDRIHRFHQGPNQHLINTYTGSVIKLAVGAAIANGIITEAEAGPDLLELLRSGIEFARWYAQEGEEDGEDGEGESGEK